MPLPLSRFQQIDAMFSASKKTVLSTIGRMGRAKVGWSGRILAVTSTRSFPYGNLLPDSLLLVSRKADGTYDALFYRWDRPANENVRESLGGAFASRPAVTGDWKQKIEIFGIGLDGALLYKNFQDGEWFPAGREWQTLAEGGDS